MTGKTLPWTAIPASSPPSSVSARKGEKKLKQVFFLANDSQSILSHNYRVYTTDAYITKFEASSL